MQAQTYNDTQLDALSRSVFYATLKVLNKGMTTGSPEPDEEFLHALAASLEAAACGFKDDDEDEDPDMPAGLRQTTPFNDDLINESSREVYVKALERVQGYVQGNTPINFDRLHAYARVADAAACGFREDDD